MAQGEQRETVGQRIRRLRQARGMTQRLLSTEGVSYAYVSRIEAGQRQPSLKALRILAERLDVPLEYLETGEDVPAARERELRLADAEIELRLNRDLERAGAMLHELIAEEADDAVDARARAALGMVAVRRNENAEAVRHLEAATATPYVRPVHRSDAYEALASAYVAVGEPRKAITLLLRCLEAVEESAPEVATVAIRYRTFLGTVYSAIGSFERARAVLSEATEAVEGYAPPSARVVHYLSLARLSWMQADSEAALRYMHRAIGLLEATDDALQLSRAHLLSGQICNLDKRFEEAAEHLKQAERLIVLGADQDDVGILRAEQAKLAAHEGDAKRALALAKEGLALLKDDARHAPTAWHAMGAARVAAGQLPAAEKAFRLAVEGLTKQGSWRQAAQAARDWALALRAADRNDDAYRLFERAMLLTLREEQAERA